MKETVILDLINGSIGIIVIVGAAWLKRSLGMDVAKVQAKVDTVKELVDGNSTKQLESLDDLRKDLKEVNEKIASYAFKNGDSKKPGKVKGK